MTSLIFNSVVRALQPLLLFFSVFLLLSGHHAPGGGFTGGMVAASAFVLYGMATDTAAARRALRVPLPVLMGVGLLLALASGLVSVVSGEPFLTSVWLKFGAGVLGEVELGTPLLFDLGVYLVVMGVTLTFVASLAEE
ncbi:Na+/H+ antiporter subunit B [Myxococcus sp. RHSTA-1-4]|uniref:Na+/H+ antiporter subunit B n=1 Tax=Myxococcus sp. RHSTA-1-4 TaxID=2874601 RepID=UPI001CC04B97|nr:Na+/H+ antiporter subunit B [Myxococcus sp. RHSTA-1-4]MBZ4420006.1 Na+/H+ antiporter subunit B [Myxococcus sp. RHSTA-1-4]